jgi:hypothetical protein
MADWFRIITQIIGSAVVAALIPFIVNSAFLIPWIEIKIPQPHNSITKIQVVNNGLATAKDVILTIKSQKQFTLHDNSSTNNIISRNNTLCNGKISQTNTTACQNINLQIKIPRISPGPGSQIDITLDNNKNTEQNYSVFATYKQGSATESSGLDRLLTSFTSWIAISIIIGIGVGVFFSSYLYRGIQRALEKKSIVKAAHDMEQVSRQLNEDINHETRYWNNLYSTRIWTLGRNIMVRSLIDSDSNLLMSFIAL